VSRLPCLQRRWSTPPKPTHPHLTSLAFSIAA
jgi:hypothetical protein